MQDAGTKETISKIVSEKDILFGVHIMMNVKIHVTYLTLKYLLV